MNTEPRCSLEWCKWRKPCKKCGYCRRHDICHKSSVSHPAKYSNPVLEAVASFVPPTHNRVFDPMAGVGGIRRLPHSIDHKIEVFGMEIEKEWAAEWSNCFAGNLLDAPGYVLDFLYHHSGWSIRPDVIATSPTYGNRMADHHNARDPSKRMTYRHQLGRALHADNSGQLQWGPGYMRFHEIAWERCWALLGEYGRLVVDIRDHIRGGERQRVTEWHMRTLFDLGFKLVGFTTVDTPGMGFGANRDTRAGPTIVMAWDK